MRFARILLLATLAILAVQVAATAAELTKDTLATVKKNIEEKKGVLVDVREKSEWDKGHVRDAIPLPLSLLRKEADPKAIAKLLPKDRIIYTHCVAGQRCVAAGNILEKLGYEVRPIKPGYQQLIKAGFEQAKE